MIGVGDEKNQRGLRRKNPRASSNAQRAVSTGRTGRGLSEVFAVHVPDISHWAVYVGYVQGVSRV